MNSAVQVDLSGKQALVTGGARGLGAAIARRLAAAGASVLGLDRLRLRDRVRAGVGARP
ncbi:MULTISPECIES: SDR family NAD(P)-dependent oxidoreductase [Streptomyces]|uniref:SDR family NAD(P)-dependent oxidoreductase n=1 Tax=Streptomyces TaxID=1883 RepID=UPI0027E37E4C|nr:MULTISPECIES: SDR family NAD(P)-dependent oxidoreductase [Streptomyces]